jgi:hypothetical protein
LGWRPAVKMDGWHDWCQYLGLRLHFFVKAWRYPVAS